MTVGSGDAAMIICPGTGERVGDGDGTGVFMLRPVNAIVEAGGDADGDGEGEGDGDGDGDGDAGTFGKMPIDMTALVLGGLTGGVLVRPANGRMNSVM